MKLDTRRRWLLLCGLLTLTLSAAAWVRENGKESDVEVPETPVHASRSSRADAAPATPAVERVRLDKLHRHRTDAASARADDAFAPRSWRRPAPKPAVVVALAPPSPVAPPLPFIYVGKLLSEEIRAVFLVQGERNLIVHEGDVIDSTYRVEQLSESDLTLIHLATGTRQSLSIGEPQ